MNMYKVIVEYFNKYGMYVGCRTYMLPGELVDGVAEYLQTQDDTSFCGQKPAYAYVSTGRGNPRIVLF